MGLPLFELNRERNETNNNHRTIISRCKICPAAQQLRLEISIKNDMLWLDFFDEERNELVFDTFTFIDEDLYKSFDDFSEKGQQLLLERLSDAIVGDISNFISGKYEGVTEPDEPYFSIGGCLDINTYMEYWLAYYELISDDEDILDEYTDPEE